MYETVVLMLQMYESRFIILHRVLQIPIFYGKICKKLRKNEAACLCASRYLHNCRGLAKYTTLTGGLKFRFLISFCLNKSLVFSEKHGLTFEL